LGNGSVALQHLTSKHAKAKMFGQCVDHQWSRPERRESQKPEGAPIGWSGADLD